MFLTPGEPQSIVDEFWISGCVTQRKGQGMEKDRIEILLEDIQHKAGLIAEGHIMLNQKIDRVTAELNQKIDRVAAEQKIYMDTGFAIVNHKIERLDHKIDQVTENLGQKLDQVAADLAAHRADTEVHRTYRVVKPKTKKRSTT